MTPVWQALLQPSLNASPEYQGIKTVFSVRFSISLALNASPEYQGIKTLILNVRVSYQFALNASPEYQGIKTAGRRVSIFQIVPECQPRISGD